MPTLATTRTAKTPFTPRLAPSAASASSSQSGRSARTDVNTTPRLATVNGDDSATPVKSFINSNVTPRSSARKSRVGISSSASTPTGTPSGTPANTRPASTIDFPPKDQGYGVNGLGINGFNHTRASGRPRSVVGGNNAHNSRSPVPSVYSPHDSDVGGARDGSPMFFHASDVKPQDPVIAPKKQPTFFYANGKEDASLRPQEMPSPPLSSVGRPSLESKFFHADSVGESKGNIQILTPPISKSPEQSSPLNSTHHPFLRPPSPLKDNLHLSYRKGASQVIRPNIRARPPALSILPGQSHVSSGKPPNNDSGYERTSRRSSAASAVARLGHGKSSSLSSIDSVSSLRKVPSHQSDLSAITPSPIHREKRIISTSSSILESIASEPAPYTETVAQIPSPTASSPTKSLQQMNELAANARRERKVLDLEISNSSLLAINRQLEKEVRKQKAELRRYRRMTRAGRFSFTSAVSASGEFSAIAASETGHQSDVEEADGADDDFGTSDSESSFDEGEMSPDALADRDAGYRLKDEKRLQLDLSKHRELLIDSQKMNQSIKRCLDWSEELIKDAKKALSYEVKAGDVRLGGRVLSVEEDAHDDSPGESRALLSPWTPPVQSNDPFERASLGGSDRTDRDSGVDLDGSNALSSAHIDETPSRPPRNMSQLGETY